MSQNSKIEWTEWSWNPTTGCSKVSAGCKNCYAEMMANRLKHMNVKGYENGFQLTLLPDRLSQPLNRKKPTTYFVNSMSDLFHEEIPDNYIDKIFRVIEQSPQHIFQILTKRAVKMYQYCSKINVPENAWLGVSVENIKHGLPRIDLLRQINAKIKFISVEPLLEDLGEMDLTNIQWVIVGGESGPNARFLDKRWVENIKVQCEKSLVPFFFKQWGRWGEDGIKRNKKENGALLSGKLCQAKPIYSTF